MSAAVQAPHLAAQWTSNNSGKDAKHLGELRERGLLQRRESSQRRCFSGVETWPELVWEDWELGKDFTKTLVLKNVDSKLQKLRFRPPVSKFFTTFFPQIIVLSPGISFSMPVTFRPLERCEYEDNVEFWGKDSTFRVTLRAATPRHSVEIPESVLLPLCAVQHSSRTTFLFRNASKLQTCFQWESVAPFHLSPERGLLKPGEQCQVAVVFRPQEALLHQQEARCKFGEEGQELENLCTVLLEGLAKYPYLQLKSSDRKQEVDSAALHLGSVPVGVSVQKHFDVTNPSPMMTSFSLSRLPGASPLLGSEFSCDLTNGEVAPGASLRVTVTYAPLAADAVSVDYLSLNYPGALSKALLKLTGKCVGPVVTLSSPAVDFGCVEQGEEVVRSVELLNASPAEAVYQWDLDCSGHSVFTIEPAGGALRPHSRATLKVVYRPTHPIAHYRRVACLILHKDPVFLDLIGTCHLELQQPALLRPRHLALYRRHRHRGLAQYPPDLLGAMLLDCKLQLDQQGALCLPEENPDQEVDSVSVMDNSPMEEYHQACSGGMAPLSAASFSSSPHVTVQPAELLFNHGPSPSSSSSSSASRSVSITNHTKGKLSLLWTVAQDSPFSVSPVSCDLGPLKCTSFRVTYDPQQLNTLHGAQLECFAVYKILRDHRQVDERLLCPPWCVTVRVIGHSFQPGKEHFIPRCSLLHPLVVFPALSVPAYRTVLLHNSGDLPLTFYLDPDQVPDHGPDPTQAASVLMVPGCGSIHPGEHQILTLASTPTEDSPKEGFSMSLQLNAAKHTQELIVVSVAEQPCVSMEGESGLYFQPTAVGSQSQRSHSIRNLSRLPLRFQWRICEEDQKIIAVHPDSGELLPNESAVQTWSFSPLEETTHTRTCDLTFWPTQNPGCKESSLSLKVTGMGAKGVIQAENAVQDLGEMLVGGCQSFEVPLVNRSLCAVSFCLTAQQTLQDEELIYDPNTEPNAFQLDAARGTIASCSRMLVRSTVTPHRRGRYQWTISYQTLSSTGCVLSTMQMLCEVRAEGVFPTLQVTDARGGGSVDGLSKVRLWNLFSLDGLNEHLLSSPAPSELTYGTPTRHSVRRCPSTFTTAVVDVNFSAAPLGSEPATVLLLFDNPGSIPVDWAFLFPKDQQIELEYWTETGEFSSTELSQMKIQDNHLFSISPSSGTLQPGQQRAVHFSYRHEFVGTDRLPILFKLSHGREIQLNFQGVTVERDRPYLHYTSSRHVFTPIAIGGFSPPRQVYELYNGGGVPLHYHLDTAPLKQLQVDNFNQPVLCCLNPEGEVLPGKTAQLEWLLAPLEAKMYRVNVPIHIQDGESMVVSFEGCGFDARVSGSPGPHHLHGAQPSVPCVQRVPLPGQELFLSEERIVLGDIPVCSRPTRILFLNNVSNTDTVHYAWDNQQVVQIHPERGTLCPGEGALFVLTLTASGSPAIYQQDLTCQITQKEALTRYQDALQRWEEEQERQRNEFTITEKDLNDASGTTVNKEHPVVVRSELPVRKYKTLPPIRSSSSIGILTGMCARPTRAERRAQREAAAVWRRPEPPRPARLHLGVTARSHSLLEYQKLFPDQLNKHYVYRPPQDTSPSPQASSSSTPLHAAGLPPLIHGPQRQIVTQILGSLLRSVLDDPSFGQALVDGASEPIPYFSQLRETSPPRASPSISSPPSHRETPPPPASLSISSPPSLRESPLPPASPSMSSPPSLRETPPPPASPSISSPPSLRETPPPPASPSISSPPSLASPCPPSAYIHPTPPPHCAPDGTGFGRRERRHPVAGGVGVEGGPSRKRQQTKSMPHMQRAQNTHHVHSQQNIVHVENMQHSQCTEQPSQSMQEDPVQDSMHRSREFSDLCEDILLNTVQNIMMEAFHGELILTARPRIITLPPVSTRRPGSSTRRISRGVAESEKHLDPARVNSRNQQGLDLQSHHTSSLP